VREAVNQAFDEGWSGFIFAIGGRGVRIVWIGSRKKGPRGKPSADHVGASAALEKQ
jgi:hypothetical protein